jgi:thioredoxin-like negative regulator of GroEL
VPSVERSVDRPKLLFFFSRTSGLSRRVEARLEQLLQARGNHETFACSWIDADRFPALAERLQITGVPTIVVLEGDAVAARLEGGTRAMGVGAIRAALTPWLR